MQNYYFYFAAEMLYFKQPKNMRGNSSMTNTTIHTFAYRYFSFTYFAGKACFGLAESKGV